jgi:predicted XRE-type DNA-binding protein
LLDLQSEEKVWRFFTSKGRMVAPRIRRERSVQNVFSDLGLPCPEQELLKARLTLRIYKLIKQRDITQAKAAKLLGIRRSHVSLLMRNRARSFSVERLRVFLKSLR